MKPNTTLHNNTIEYSHLTFYYYIIKSCTRVGLYIPSSNGNTVNRLRRKTISQKFCNQTSINHEKNQ